MQGDSSQSTGFFRKSDLFFGITGGLLTLSSQAGFLLWLTAPASGASLIAWCAWLFCGWLHKKDDPSCGPLLWREIVLVWILAALACAFSFVIAPKEPTPIEAFKALAVKSGYFFPGINRLDRTEFGNCDSGSCYVINQREWRIINGKYTATFTLGGLFPNTAAEEAYPVNLEIGKNCWAEIRADDKSFRLVVDDSDGPEFKVWYGLVENLYDLKGYYIEATQDCKMAPNSLTSERDFQIRICASELSEKYPWSCPPWSELSRLPSGVRRFFTR